MKAIQANPEDLRSVFSKHQFVVPEFQRPYSWEKEQCEQLWDDIAHFCENPDQQEQYFLGSVVVYPDPSTNKIWHVVDGQQRITTLMILIKVLFENVGTMTILEKLLHKEDPNTGEIIRKQLRIKTQVQAGKGRDDANDLQVTIMQRGDYTSPKSTFKQNYDCLKNRVNEWWVDKTTEERKQCIITILDKIVLLPIECDSLNDALDLFQIINDRGLQLGDEDIFKAKMYGAIKNNTDKEDFVARWGNLQDHGFLFRLFMYVSRAQRKNTGKEINLRKYIQTHHLDGNQSLKTEWGSIMRGLELFHWVWNETDSLCDTEENTADELIYWQILRKYPNVYWQYPVFVFLHKYVQGNAKQGFALPKNKHTEYLGLLRNTLKYFYVRGLAYNTVNQVKEVTFRVCVAIEHGEGYSQFYAHGIVDKPRNDLATIDQRLHDCEYGRCLAGMVFINCIPTNQKDRVKYAEALRGESHIEHILPRKWNDYDRWDNESHTRDINKLGNLMPLEYKVNIAASNEFFKRKQEKYKESKFPVALELSKKNPSTWHPQDVEKRHAEANKRLLAFFREPFGD